MVDMQDYQFSNFISLMSFLVKVFAVWMVWIKIDKISGLWGLAFISAGFILRIPIFVMLLLGLNGEKLIDEWNSRLSLFVLPVSSILFALFAISIVKQFTKRNAGLFE